MILEDVLHDLPGLRLQAESLMLDTARAERPAGRVYDSTEQAEVDTFTDLFTSPCKVKARNVAALAQEVGARTATTVRLEVHFPVTTEALQVGDVIEVTAVADVSTAVVGARYRVTAPVDGTYLTARRYEVDRVVS